jgi:hypothetical protein
MSLKRKHICGTRSGFEGISNITLFPIVLWKSTIEATVK